jgi:peptidoglycan/xylan/chitin deacetylase (PgdA/CDA1 family)
MTATHPSVVFLMYHELALPGRGPVESEPGYVRYVLDAREFEWQMRAIRDMGLRGIGVSQALEFPSRSVAITFDDGCETDLLIAAPVLQQFGFRATFYVVAGWIGKPGFLSAGQIRELDDAGFEIGCHSMTHAYLSDLDPPGLHREIREAKDRIEQLLGGRIEHFSCPGGRSDPRAAAIAKEAGFETVSTSVPRANRTSTNPFSLGRVVIKRGASADGFQNICLGRGLWKIELGGDLRDRAKRILGNRTYDRMRSLILGK